MFYWQSPTLKTYSHIFPDKLAALWDNELAPRQNKRSAKTIATKSMAILYDSSIKPVTKLTAP